MHLNKRRRPLDAACTQTTYHMGYHMQHQDETVNLLHVHTYLKYSGLLAECGGDQQADGCHLGSKFFIHPGAIASLRARPRRLWRWSADWTQSTGLREWRGSCQARSARGAGSGLGRSHSRWGQGQQILARLEPGIVQDLTDAAKKHASSPPSLPSGRPRNQWAPVILVMFLGKTACGGAHEKHIRSHGHAGGRSGCQLQGHWCPDQPSLLDQPDRWTRAGDDGV